MTETKKLLEALIRAMEDHFAKTGGDRTMEYTFGYMDAVGFLRDVATGRAGIAVPTT